MTNTPTKINATPPKIWPLTIRMIAAGNQTSAVPTTGRMLSSAMTDAPEHGRADAEHRERDAADRALHDADDERALDRRARHLREPPEQVPLALIAERQRAHERFEHSRPVAQEEEQEIQHQEKEHRDAQRALADRQRALCDRSGSP